MIYLLLVPLACCVRPDMYPGNFAIFVKNATSWHCSYIGEQWFFLPYVLLMAFSKWIFRLFDKVNWYVTFLIGLIVYGFSVYMLKRYGEATLAGNMLFYNIFLSFYMLFPFLLGYMAKKYQWIENANAFVNKRICSKPFIPVTMLLGLCTIRCFVPNASVDPLYAIIFVVLFSMISVPKVLGAVLSYLGKHSMNIWLIHTWFSNRLFHDFLYDTVHYPIAMYVSLMVVSLAISHIVEMLYKPIGKYVNKINF